jgi:hypothetical protein
MKTEEDMGEIACVLAYFVYGIIMLGVFFLIFYGGG